MVIMILELVKFKLVDTMFIPGDITMMVSSTELILLLLNNINNNNVGYDHLD